MLFAEPVGDGAGLDDGVRFERITVFDDVAFKADVLQRLEFLVFGSKDMCKVPNLSGVARSYNK